MPQGVAASNPPSAPPFAETAPPPAPEPGVEHLAETHPDLQAILVAKRHEIDRCVSGQRAFVQLTFEVDTRGQARIEASGTARAASLQCLATLLRRVHYPNALRGRVFGTDITIPYRPENACPQAIDVHGHPIPIVCD